jgi:hypothetical protein
MHFLWVGAVPRGGWPSAISGFVQVIQLGELVISGRANAKRPDPKIEARRDASRHALVNVQNAAGSSAIGAVIVSASCTGAP